MFQILKTAPLEIQVEPGDQVWLRFQIPGGRVICFMETIHQKLDIDSVSVYENDGELGMTYGVVKFYGPRS